MLKPHFVAWMICAGLTVLGAGLVSGQDPSTELRTGYPNKPVRIIANEAGSTGDFALRMMLPEISRVMGQQMVIENHPGSALTPVIVAKATPDGYTLLLTGLAFWTGPLLQDMPYDPVRDFSPVTLLLRQPTLLVVHPSLPVKSVKELIALAKAKPGALNYGTAGIGGATHLAAELFKAMAGVNIVRINYRGNGSAVTDLIAGQVQMMFSNGGLVTPYVKSGRLRAVAVGTPEPSALYPGLPTFAASGLRGYVAGNVTVLFAPAKTPEANVKRVNQVLLQVANQADMKEKFLNTGSEVAGSSPEQLAAEMKADIARMGKVIKDAGIRVE